MRRRGRLPVPPEVEGFSALLDMQETMHGPEAGGYLDRPADRRGNPISFAHAAWLKFSVEGYDRVGDAYFAPPDYPFTRVSTVWLGVPTSYGRRFETLIFSDNDTIDARMWRWRTLRQAEIGHRKLVREVTKTLARPVALAKHRRSWR